MADTTDRQLLERVRRYIVDQQQPSPECRLSCQSDWDQFFSIYSDVLHRFFESKQIPKVCTADLAQEVWMTVWTHLPTFQHRGNKGSLRHWLWQIARTKAIDISDSRTRKVRQILVDTTSLLGQHTSAQEQSPHALLEKEFDRRLVEVALNRLKAAINPRDSAIFERYYLDDESTVSIAEDLKIKNATVRQALMRARDKFRQILRDLGFDNQDLSQ